MSNLLTEDQGVAADAAGLPGKPEPEVSALRAGIPNAEEAFWLGIDYACGYLAGYARRLGGKRDWQSDSIGWPVDCEGAARRELHAFADLIEECRQHEGLSPTFLSLAQATEARRAETGTGSVEDESAVAKRCAQTPSHTEENSK